ncbi:MAG: protein-export chaperone SecB [Gammaproteobacteria bacterium]|nr:protein-export chaperone SecB [Gammaproteobacteria bacterium]NNC98534.1 protein-export chaperone SecB [Gammaproteobacteria bacterium]NNM13247.1 protein-export chaperone SecB [Gammaproteobacteria bacterium]
MAENENSPENLDNNAASGEQAQAQSFAIRTVYLKDCSFESPNTPAIFSQNMQPKINVNVNSGASNVQENLHEVVLTLSVTAQFENDDKTVFHSEVQQAGLFESQGLDPQQLHQLLGTFAPSQLFPYAREAVNNLINKGGFQSVPLQPINFDALYVQHMQQLADQQQAAAGQNPPQGNA